MPFASQLILRFNSVLRNIGAILHRPSAAFRAKRRHDFDALRADLRAATAPLVRPRGRDAHDFLTRSHRSAESIPLRTSGLHKLGPAGEHVLDTGHAKPPLAGRHLGDVGRSGFVRTGRGKGQIV